MMLKAYLKWNPSLPAYLRWRFGISRRTFRRWCASGYVPGAYCTPGGHWRVRKPAWPAKKKAFRENRRPTKNRRELVRRAILDYPCPPISRDFIQREKREAKFWMAANEISDEDLRDSDLKKRDREKYHLLWEKPIGPNPPYFDEVLADPKRAPAIAAVVLKVNRRRVTQKALATELGISLKTLYRKYPIQEIRRLCRQTPGPVLESRGKKTPIKAPH